MVYFYANYEYKTPALSGGGMWAYGLPKGKVTGSTTSTGPGNLDIGKDNKSSPTKGGTQNVAPGRASRFRYATSTASPRKGLTSLATSTVSQTEAHGHITSM